MEVDTEFFWCSVHNTVHLAFKNKVGSESIARLAEPRKSGKKKDVRRKSLSLF